MFLNQNDIQCYKKDKLLNTNKVFINMFEKLLQCRISENDLLYVEI